MKIEVDLSVKFDGSCPFNDAEYNACNVPDGPCKCPDLCWNGLREDVVYPENCPLRNKEILVVKKEQ